MELHFCKSLGDKTSKCAGVIYNNFEEFKGKTMKAYDLMKAKRKKKKTF